MTVKKPVNWTPPPFEPIEVSPGAYRLEQTVCDRLRRRVIRNCAFLSIFFLAVFLYANSKWTPWGPLGGKVGKAPSIWVISILCFSALFLTMLHSVFRRGKVKTIEIRTSGGRIESILLNGRAIEATLEALDLRIKDGTQGPWKSGEYLSICAVGRSFCWAVICTIRPADFEAWCARFGLRVPDPLPVREEQGVLE